MVWLLEGIERALEEVVAPAPFGVTAPVGVVVVLRAQEALGVRHKAHGAAGGVLQAGDTEFGTIVVVCVLQSYTAGLHVFLGIAGFADKAAFCVSGGEFELLWQVLREGAGGGDFHQLVPHAFKALALVPDERGFGQDAELGENLEAVADAEEEAAVGVVLLQGIAEETFSFQLGQATAHHVVAIGETAGEDHELSLGNMLRCGSSNGLHLGGETGSAQRALGLHIAVGSRIFQ